MLQQWDADSKEELSLANKELTAVSKLIFSEIQNYSFTFKDFESVSSNTVQYNVVFSFTEGNVKLKYICVN